MVKYPKAFVTGYPLNHSRSPHIHRYWLGLHRIEGCYEAVESTVENFSAFIRSLQEKKYCGGNITLPHKESAFALSEKRDAVATCIGSVNTLWFEKNVLCGSNTDAYGFVCNLNDFAPNWIKNTAIVIGAGGVSRAILFALLEQGFKKIFLVNRTRSKADHLARYFCKGIIVVDWECVNVYVDQVDLIVNTTSLGMKSYNRHGIHNSLNIDFRRANSNAVVTDVVYTPLETNFLKRARKEGLKTVNGIGMLLHQAVPGFERWFGIRPQVTKELRSHVLISLGEKEV